MTSPSELSLDCKPHSYSMLLKSFADQHNSHDPTQIKLEDFLSRLEEERLKIDAFKRELPLCMQLLTNAVESSRQQLQAYRANNQLVPTRPILEEFIPLRTSSSEGSEKTTNTSDKANWMTSAQLWSQSGAINENNGTKLQTTINNTNTISQVINKDQSHDHISFNVSPKLALDNKPRNGGAFLPFSKDRGGSSGPRPLPELALASPEKEMAVAVEDKKSCLEGETNGVIRRENCGNKVGINGTTNNNTNNNNNGVAIVEQGKLGNGNLAEGQIKNNGVNNNNNNNNNSNTVNGSTNNANSANNQSTHRKARRCWSPDLHRRFVSALQILGGSQVATPKQIRELMKVDGLTNDEVKSHLQKYRLHTRRPSPSPQVPGTAPPQLVVLGGIWVPPEYASAAAAAHGGGPTALYSTHHPASHAPPHYCGPPVLQDFYGGPAATAMAPHHHHAAALHHQLHMYKAAAASQITHSSPESNGRGAGAGDRSESIEDGKSESSSWKGESCENGGGDQRKGLAALREDGEESNGSEITLKF